MPILSGHCRYHESWAKEGVPVKVAGGLFESNAKLHSERGFHVFEIVCILAPSAHRSPARSIYKHLWLSPSLDMCCILRLRGCEIGDHGGEKLVVL